MLTYAIELTDIEQYKVYYYPKWTKGAIITTIKNLIQLITNRSKHP